MRLSTLRALGCTAVLAFAAACVDAPSAPQAQFATATSNVCTATLSGLLDQARVLFGPSASNFNSVRGKLENLTLHLQRNRTSQAQQRAHDIVAFTLELRDAGRLSGTPAQITAFINGVYCFAGIDITIDTPEDTWFILPSDAPQILYGLDSTVGISLPGFPVSEPSLLRVERFEGQLNTKLDQYPGFIRITLLNDGGTALTGRATITVCAVDVPDPAVAARLRLGHGIRDTGFVITPEPTSADPVPANIACEETPTFGIFARLMGAVRETFGPRRLEASSSVRRFGGGVSGTVTEFSPFAPVDPILSFGGGVSGTVTEFTRSSLEALDVPSEPSCTTAPVGTDLPAECLPLVSVRTFNGTILEQVPVDWTVLSTPLGRVAARSGNLDAISCGSYAVSVATATSVNGNAGVCWVLGDVGMNRVVARARAGGDAPEGVTFSNGGGDSVLFSVDVTPVTLMVLGGSGGSYLNGSEIWAEVKAKNAAGAPVAGVEVSWAPSGGSVASMSSRTGTDGVARVQWTLGSGINTLDATIRNAPSTTVQLTNEGLGGDGLPTEIVLVSGDGQSGPAGSPLAAPLVVRVTDAAGAALGGVTVHWSLLSGSGALSATSTVTDASGLAQITFSPGSGGSVVKAYIDSYVFRYVYFTSLTGVVP